MKLLIIIGIFFSIAVSSIIKIFSIHIPNVNFNSFFSGIPNRIAYPSKPVYVQQASYCYNRNKDYDQQVHL